MGANGKEIVGWLEYSQLTISQSQSSSQTTDITK